MDHCSNPLRSASCAWGACASRHRAERSTCPMLTPGAGARGLAEGAAHPGLQAVGARAGEHPVDAEDVEGLRPHQEVEQGVPGSLPALLGHVLVARDPGRPPPGPRWRRSPSPTPRRFWPTSKMRIFGSGTPRQSWSIAVPVDVNC
ncbi:hypothetical protein SEVIR_9G419250v4 [Setaria viridis]